jgi:hypothetical protein
MVVQGMLILSNMEEKHANVISYKFAVKATTISRQGAMQASPLVNVPRTFLARPHPSRPYAVL